MTLQELSESYAYSAELLSRRLAQLRQEEREARDESQRFSLHRRILDLEPLLRQCRPAPPPDGPLLRQELLPG